MISDGGSNDDYDGGCIGGLLTNNFNGGLFLTCSTFVGLPTMDYS